MQLTHEDCRGRGRVTENHGLCVCVCVCVCVESVRYFETFLSVHNKNVTKDGARNTPTCTHTCTRGARASSSLPHETHGHARASMKAADGDPHAPLPLPRAFSHVHHQHTCMCHLRFSP